MTTHPAPPSEPATEPVPSAEPTIEQRLSQSLMGVFDLVIHEREGHFHAHPKEIPTEATIGGRIQYYSLINAGISGGVSLIPGPFGMAAAIPEIVAVMRNQLALIYEVGLAYGKKDVLTRELLAGVLMTALGTSAGTLLVMHGSKVLVKRVALRVFQRVILVLAGRVTQQILKSMISKWLPVIGAAGMAAWSNYLTRTIGKKAVEIMQRDIEIEASAAEEVDDEEQSTQDLDRPQHPQPRAAAPRAPTLDMLKIRALTNLMKIDGKVLPVEREYIATLLARSGLAAEDEQALRAELDDEAPHSVDFSLFASHPDESIGMLVDLVALGKRDGDFHVTERLYVKQAGRAIGFSDQDVAEIMA
ncbi:MAG: TerB family tellurite resistance protein [Pseudomonadota bacterium]